MLLIGSDPRMSTSTTHIPEVFGMHSTRKAMRGGAGNQMEKEMDRTISQNATCEK
jgi:hypothetical protein